jgi:hypothetical protein
MLTIVASADHIGQNSASINSRLETGRTMISKSVGDPKKAANSKADVMIVEKAFNKWQKFLNSLTHNLLSAQCRLEELRVSDLIYLPENGTVGKDLLERIEKFQREVVKIEPDSVISPKKNTIKALCPVAFGRPTSLGVRASDVHGKGHYGASRGTRKHKGTDYTTKAGEHVKAPMSGVIARISSPYSNPSKSQKKINTGIQINASDGTVCKLFYVKLKENMLGEVVWPGEVIGTALSLQGTYKGITDHTHVQITNAKGITVDPTTLIR